MTNSPLTKEYEESRKYDIQIATLLGMRDIKYIEEYGDYYGHTEGVASLNRVPRYADSIAAAWQIIDHIQKDTDLYFDISSAGGGGLQYRCDLTEDEDAANKHLHVGSSIYSIEDTPARAIVSSFLKWQELQDEC